MKKALLNSLSKALNKFLHLDPETKRRLDKLHGKKITIELLPLHLRFQCFFTDECIQIENDDGSTTETTIVGTPIQLLSVMFAKDERQRFFADDVTMLGNAELGQQVIELFDTLKIDWEELSSHWIGDIPAYHTGRLVRGITSWINQAQHSLTTNINEYVHEEALWLPSKEELNDFFTDIDQLRMDADRIEMKMNYLKEKFNEECR